jgi:hypothetical protein
MNFKLVSKNNMSIVATLLLVILLSQSNVFNFLLDTHLGRSILILFILFISYTNKILGIVSVLLIVILFNNSDLAYLEGFTSEPSGNQVASTISSNLQAKKQQIKSSLQSSSEGFTSSDPSGNTVSTDIENKKKQIQQEVQTAKTNQSTTTTAAEGFDIIGTENNIKRGKQSNSIPVSDHMRESNDISPYEGFSFTENFSQY